MSIREKFVAVAVMMGLLGTPGCQSLQSTLAQMKNGAFKKTDGQNGRPASANKSKTPGYLAQGGGYSSPVMVEPQPDVPEKPMMEETESKGPTVRESEETADENHAAEESAKEKLQYERKIEGLKAELELEKKKSDQLQKKTMQLEVDLLKKSQEADRMRMDVMAKQAMFNAQYPGFYEVGAGDSLWTIAQKDNIYKNPFKWIEIFYANQDKVANPDLIYPGLVLKIPRYLEMLWGSVEASGGAVEAVAPEEKEELEEAKENPEPDVESRNEPQKTAEDPDDGL